MFDPNPMPPGLHQHTLVIKTRDRDIAFTASSKERHDLWFNAVQYLLSRPDNSNNNGAASSSAGGPGATPTATRRTRSRTSGAGEDPSSFFGLPSDQVYSFGGGQASASDSRLTPRAHHSTTTTTTRGKGSMASRPGTAADDYRRRSVLLGTPRSLRSFGGRPLGDNDGGYEGESLEVVDRGEIPAGLSGDEDGDDDAAFDGLENLRACCNGKHDGELSLSRVLLSLSRWLQ